MIFMFIVHEESIASAISFDRILLQSSSVNVRGSIQK